MDRSREAGHAVSFVINGQEVMVPCDPRRRLIDVIRDLLGLTGTKEGCGEGVCGSCMVLIDGRPVKSCVTPASAADGRTVLTIEGLGTAAKPDPIQRAFVEAGAIQCGFCTAGMIISAKALLDRNPSPSREDILQGLAGNLCRCTGYKKIVEAVMRAAEFRREERRCSADPYPLDVASSERHEAERTFLQAGSGDASAGTGSGGTWGIGRIIYPVEAWKKSLGLMKYAGDVTPEGCVHLKIVRSERDHAHVLDIDGDEAFEVPGVIAVLTSADVAGTNRIGPIVRDQPVLADRRVRYRGEAIAVVAADSKEAAEEGMNRVRVRYEDIEPVFDPLEAVGPASPLLHQSGNMLARMEIRKGNIDEGFHDSDVVVESWYETPFNEHAYLEPEAGVAWKDEDGRITVQLATQNPHENQQQVAAALGIPVEDIRVIQAPTGGSFGGKLNHQVAAILALAALKLSRPAKLVLARSESLVSTEKRHPFKMRFKTGANRDGKLLALEAELIANTGAYASYGKAVLERALIHASGPYEFPNVSLTGTCVYTNAPPAGAMRGFGAPQVAFAIESQIDLLAERLGIDPLEFRRRNVLRKGSFTSTGQLLDASVGAGKTLEAVEPYYREALSWVRSPVPSASAQRLRRGVGIASIFFGIGEAGWKNPSRIRIRLTPDGWIELLVGAADMGQGVYTTLAQIASQTLEIPIGRFRVITPDTGLTPSAGPTEASRQTLASGLATQRAAEFLRNVLARLGLNGKSGEPWQTALSRAYRACVEGGLPTEYDGYFEPAIQPIDATGKGKPHLAYSFASHLAQVEVDLQTGAVRVVRLVSAHDVGKAINPLALEGQIEGGLMMALGFALMEEFRPGVTRRFAQYRMPRTTDLPEMVNIIVEEETPEGPYGAKGIGEVPAVGPASAIANAVANACGVRCQRLPITRESLRAVLSYTEHR